MNNQENVEQAFSNAAAQFGNPDDENLVLAESIDTVDELLSRFYGRFPWPWHPMKFDYLEDTGFEIALLNQDFGDWEHRTIPRDPEIWVAGCGTNQAINTALRFPTARVVGSDVSAKSLDICAHNASELGITNLEIRQESLNSVAYENEFDHVICTGVIHHNADPGAVLKRLAKALKPNGIMEMMVYNRYHRIVTSAFQKAVRIFGENRGVDFEADLDVARMIADNVPVKELLERGFIQYMDISESDFADLLIQPVERSYTVESLESLAATCGLELQAPCISQYAKYLATTSWDMEFKSAALQALYDALPDSRRWQITNLILHERSPLLWFYLRRKDSEIPRKSEKQICEEFQETRFERAGTTQRSYVRGRDGVYKLSSAAVRYPLAPPDPSIKDVFDLLAAQITPKEAFELLKMDPTFQEVNNLRLNLTTSAYPYLKAV